MISRLSAPLLTLLLCSAPAPRPAQAQSLPAQAATQSNAAAAPAQPTSETTITALVQPATAALQQALPALRVEKWKTSRSLRDATLANISSIQKDLDSTLPGLLATADASPSSVSAALPVSRNLGALYDVVLRVAVIAESSAPQEQTAMLSQAMGSLESARRSLSDRLQASALASEQQVRDLQKTLAARPAAVAPAPAAPPAKPAVTPKKKKKPAATPKPGNSQ